MYLKWIFYLEIWNKLRWVELFWKKCKIRKLQKAKLLHAIDRLIMFQKQNDNFFERSKLSFWNLLIDLLMVYKIKTFLPLSTCFDTKL